MIGSLSDLLRPHDPTLLLDAVNAHQRILLHTEQASEFSALLPWDRLNALITPDRIATKQIEMARGGFRLPAEMTVVRRKNRPGDIQLNVAALHGHCRQGFSLIINSIQGMERNIALMNAMIERELRAPVHTNAYVSFTQQSAFKPHWDDHNVLILQIHGKKVWRSWGQREPYPIGNPVHDDLMKLGSPEWEAILCPGDVLYLPRGEVHAAQVLSGEQSLHLTVGITPPRLDDLARALAHACQANPICRQDLPVIAPLQERELWVNAVKVLMHQALDTLDFDDLLAWLDRKRGPLHFTSLGMTPSIAPERRFQPALRRRPPASVFDTSPTVITAGDRTWHLNARQAAILRQALNVQTLQVSDLFPLMTDTSPADIMQSVAELAADGLLILLEG